MKWLLGFWGFGIFLLSQEWPFPRSMFDHWMIFIGYVFTIGIPFFLLMLIINRLINISFDFKYKGRK